MLSHLRHYDKWQMGVNLWQIALKLRHRYNNHKAMAALEIYANQSLCWRHVYFPWVNICLALWLKCESVSRPFQPVKGTSHL